jgi:hypothetical protein
MMLNYDRFGGRPRRVQLPDDYRTLPDDLLVALFLVLYLSAEERRRRSTSAA